MLRKNSYQLSAAGSQQEGSERMAGRRVVGLDMGEIDITLPTSVDAVFDELRPGLVINAAAYTDVDGCESNEAIATARQRGRAGQPGPGVPAARGTVGPRQHGLRV